MKIYTATVWWDVMDDDPVIFVNPNETLLETQVWAEFNAKYGEDFEPDNDDLTATIDLAGGRVVFDFLDVPGFVIVPVELAETVLGELKDWRDDEIQNIVEMGRDKPDHWGHDDGSWGRYRKESLPKLVKDFEKIVKGAE